MDFSKIFGEEALSLAQFQEKTKGMKLVDLSGGEYVAKGRFEGVNAELSKAKETIKALEDAKGDTEALQKQIEEYKAAEQKREEEAKKAKEKEDMDKRFTAVLGDKEFTSDFARDGVYAKFTSAVNDPANKGKGDAELFSGLTKDVEGVFKSKNPLAKMGNFKGSGGGDVNTSTRAAELAAQYRANLYGEGNT